MVSLRKKEYLYAITIVCIIIIFSMGFWVLQDEFKGPNVGPFSAFYWTLVTMATLGYGDITPISILGQAYSLFVVLSGIVMITLFFPVILVPVIETGLRSYELRNVKF